MTEREEPRSTPVDPTVTVPDASGRAGHVEYEQIGPYRLVRTIGEGGMGVVYLAEQTTPIRRQVAMKVIKPGMDSRAVMARFDAERQALALMSHAGVAKVFDAGAAPDGRPFFVMEYVEGEPVTDYCDRHRLPIARRLLLFAQICDAVQHAHQKGIIHRDIKPSNILIEHREGEPAAKVIDFGVAKAIEQPLTEATFATQHGHLVGTPAYMSPEQAGAAAHDIDTRSDIYSLGVVLYQLLTGTMPFDPATLQRAALDEICRVIREEEPPKPSTRLFGLAPDSIPGSDTVTRDRQSTRDALIRRIRGDLDWITMKALEKDRTRRYASAADLAADIRRHLAYEPVSAGPPSRVYLVRKFVRRNRGLVLSAALIGFVLVAGVIVSTGFAIQATHARDEASRQAGIALEALAEAQRQRDAAETAKIETERQAAIANEVNAFLNRDLLAAVRPEEQGKDVTMREVLDAAADAAELRSFDEPLVEASVRMSIGNSYDSLGLYDRAVSHLQRAFEIRQGALGDVHAETNTSRLDFANALVNRGAFGQADPLLQRGVEVAEQTEGGGHPQTAVALANLASLRRQQGRLDEAETLLTRALDIERSALGRRHPTTLRTMSNIAILYDARGRYGDAESLHREVLAARKEILGADHPDTLKSEMMVAIAMERLGRDTEAEAQYRAVLTEERRVFGEAHRSTLTTMNNLANILQRHHRFDEAEPLLTRTLELRRDVLGPDHPDTLESMNALAMLYDNRGQYEDAEPLYLETLEARKRLLGDNHQDTNVSRNNLANVYIVLKRYAEAEALLKQAIAGSEATLGQEHPYTLAFLGNLAALQYRRGLFEDARRRFEDIVQRQRAKLGDEHPSTLESMNNLAVVLLRLDDHVEAERVLRQCIAARSKTHPAGHPQIIRNKSDLAVALTTQKNFVEAEALLLEAAGSSAESPLFAVDAERLIRLYEQWNDVEPDQGYAAKADLWRAKMPDGDD